MLRGYLGEEVFWRSIKRYSEINRGSSVTTIDLQKTLEQESNQNLDPFFNKWVYGTSLPKQQDIF